MIQNKIATIVHKAENAIESYAELNSIASLNWLAAFERAPVKPQPLDFNEPTDDDAIHWSPIDTIGLGSGFSLSKY